MTTFSIFAIIRLLFERRFRMRLPNVIVVVIDALRKDYAKLLEEKLRRLGFISYDNVIAPSPWTTPSHASLLTGLPFTTNVTFAFFSRRSSIRSLSNTISPALSPM